METEKTWFWLGILWTLVGVFSILFSWVSAVEMSVYWFGCIIMGQICFLHLQVAKNHKK